MKQPHAWLAIGICVLGACLGTGCATGSGKGGGTATVTFVNPERFIDFKAGGQFGEHQREAMLRDLEDYVIAEARRVLPADRHLELRILDLNEQGIVVPTAGSVRVTSDRGQARVDLEYVLQEGGRQIAAGKEFVTGEAVRVGSGPLMGQSQPAIKDALRRWLRRVAKM